MDSTAIQATEEKVQERASDALSSAQETAQRASGQVQSRLREQVNQRSSDVGEQVQNTAGDLRSVGEELRRNGREKPAELLDQAVARVENLGDYLKRSDADKMLHDVEEIGRRKPWTIAAAGLAAGFAASRFLKASSSQRFQTNYGNGGQSPGQFENTGFDNYRGVSPGIDAGEGTASTRPEITAPPVPAGVGSPARPGV